MADKDFDRNGDDIFDVESDKFQLIELKLSAPANAANLRYFKNRQIGYLAYAATRFHLITDSTTLLMLGIVTLTAAPRTGIGYSGDQPMGMWKGILYKMSCDMPIDMEDYEIKQGPGIQRLWVAGGTSII